MSSWLCHVTIGVRKWDPLAVTPGLGSADPVSEEAAARIAVPRGPFARRCNCTHSRVHCRSCLSLLIASAVLVAACGSDDDTGTEPQPAGAPSPEGNGGGTPTTTAPPSSGARDGYKFAFDPTPRGLACGKPESAAKTAQAASVTFDASTIYVGFEQVGQNQNPLIARFDSGVERWCVRSETGGPDGRAYGLTWRGDSTVYVVYSIVGGGSELDGAAKGTWGDRYGDGGASSKVSYIGVVDATTGALTKGTFVVSKLASKGGKTNSLSPADAVHVLPSGELEFRGKPAFAPLNPDKSPIDCEGSYPQDYRVILSADLATARCASAAGCRPTAPCPE